MSMLQITGQVLNVFEKPAMKRGDDEVAAKPQVQLLGEIALPNGETRYDLVTLTTDMPRAFDEFKDQKITVDVGVFSPAKNQIIYFIPKGSKPVPV